MRDWGKIRGYAAITLSFFMVVFVYLHTMNPVFKNNDSPETSAAACTLGIGHPPGYPLHAVTAKIFSYIPAANPAFRINLYSVFLSLCVFFVTLMILKKLLKRITKKDETVLAAISAAVIMFSYMIWNQGTEAKGGIYMLNLLFLSLIIWSVMELLERFEPGRLYFISFIYGLSLANHWPSMIVLAPALAAVYLMHIKKASLKNVFFCLLFFIIGLTPYLYMFIRASADPALNWGDPSNLKNFIWVVLRKAYLGPVDATWDVYKYQIMEFLKLFFTNFGWLWLFLIPGIAAVRAYSRRLNTLLLSMSALIILVVVFYNRTLEGVKWLIQIFIMPAEYIIGLFAAAGAAYTFTLLKNKKIFARGAYLAALAAAALMMHQNFGKNNHINDYLSYDYGYNLLKTMEAGSLYAADGDYNLMPVYYIQEIEKRRRDVIFATASFLIFDWGIDDFIKKYDDIPMKPFETEKNVNNIIGHYYNSIPAYRSAFLPRLDAYMQMYAPAPKGLLIRLNGAGKVYSPSVYDMYSYRGIFEKFTKEHKNNYDLIGWYPVSMVNQANALLTEGYPKQAAELYVRAMNFPIDKPEGNIYYNTSLAYAQLNDTDNEIKYLRLAALKNADFASAYERLGLLLYDRGFLKEAQDAFIKSRERGGNSEPVSRGINALASLNDYQMNDYAFNKANQYLQKNEIIRARELYDFLLENKFKTDIIYMNLGVFHFKTRDYQKAIECFRQSNNETVSENAILYLAIALNESGNEKQALLELETGIKAFPQSKALWDLYKKIKGEQTGQ